jgi:glutathione S-transferase
MADTGEIVFYHTPHTRSSDVLRLLEELKAPYTLKVLNLRKGDQRKPEYLAINPMGKVPAIVHGGDVVTELVAIYIYLADLFPDAGLAPSLSDPLRGPYLRWLVYYAACFEPAVQDYTLKRDPAPPHTCFYGDYERVMKTLADQLAKNTYIAGERYTAADVVWGGVLNWMATSDLFVPSSAMKEYIARVQLRPAFAATTAKDAQLEAAQKAA